MSDAAGRDVSPRSRKACALLGYLLLSEQGSERREKLAGLLWSESGGDQAFDSLRHCLLELRRLEKTTGISFIHADRQSVRLDRAALQSDLTDLKRHLSAAEIGKCRALLALPELTVMAGAEADDPAFDNWLRVEREHHTEALVRDMLAILRRPGLSAADRLDLVRAIERLDPYQEDAVRIHMELLAAGGKVASAMTYFERYRTRLAREYDVEPSEELLEFAEGLAARAAGNGRAQAEIAVAAPAKAPGIASPGASPQGRGTPIIAVLPMPGLPISDDLRQLAGTFVQELVSTLCRFKEWAVIAPSAEIEADAKTTPEGVVGTLAARNVDYALLTSVAAVAGATAINVRLVECDTQTVVISDQYPASSENWLAVLNDICCRVASRTRTSFIAARLRKVTGRSIEQRQAYDLWLEGNVMGNIWDRETEEKAIELFSRALEMDSNLATAYAGWASVLNSRWIVYPGLPTDEADRQKAYQLAKRAVALDPLNSQIQGELGWSHILARRFESAELHLGLAYDLNPSNPNTLLTCALASAYCGNHARARELSRRAFDLNPFPPPFYHGYRASIDFLGRDFAACVEAVNRVPDLFPDIQAWAAASHAHLGDMPAARAAFDRFLSDIRARWAGSANPSDGALCAWIVENFPIRDDADRQLLAAGLNLARHATRPKRRVQPA